MTDRLDEIRKRHAEVRDWSNLAGLDTYMMGEDIAYLLSEVDRLQAAERKRLDAMAKIAINPHTGKPWRSGDITPP